MRKLNLLQFKNKFHVFLFFFKKRILKFKRTKWKKIQSKVFYIIKRLKFFKLKKVSIFFFKFLYNLQYLKKKVNNNYRLKFFKFLNKLKFNIKLKKFKIFIRKNKRLKRYKKYKLKRIKKKKMYEFFFCFIFFNFNVLKKNSHIYLRSRFIFKNTLYMKFIVLKYFYGCISIKLFKKHFLLLKDFKYTKILSFLFLNFEYRIDILLWRLKFFKNPYLAKFSCKKNNIFLLNKFIPNKKFLNKNFLTSGDILFCNLKYSFKKNFKAYLSSFFLPTTFEIDYYTNFIITVKNLQDITYRDINSIIKEPICIYKFKDYLLN